MHIAEQFTFDNPPKPVQAILDTVPKEPAVAVDYETFYSKKLKYTVANNLPEFYAAHELFDPYMVAVCDGKNSWSGRPKDLNWSVLEGRVWLSHNRRFDNSVFNETVKRGWISPVRYKEWHCTANLTSFLCNRRALSDAVEYLFKVHIDKSARTEAEGKRWPNDFTETERTKMLDYAKDDVKWCWRLWDKFSDRWPEDERFLSNLTIEQGMRGVQIDVPLLKKYILVSHEMLQKTEALIPWIRDAEDEEWQDFDTKPTATKCIAQQCRKIGIPCPPVKSKDEEGYEEWEDGYGDKNPWIRAVGAWRSINKLYKTFLLVKERLSSDGVLPFSLKYFGAHTGRWSGDARINFQNMRKTPAICNEHGLLEQSEARIAEAVGYNDENNKWPDWVRETIDFRALVIPRPGKKMIISDLSQIEPRVLAWLTGNHKLLGMIREGYGVYEAFARANMGVTGPKWTKKDKASDFYKMIKIQVLGLGYGCGWLKFIKIAAQGGVDITKDDPEFVEELDDLTGELVKKSGYGQRSRDIVNKFREASAQTTAFWGMLDDSVRLSVGDPKGFVMNLPSGRKLTYDDVKMVCRMKTDPITKKPVKKWELMANSDGRHKATYGGKLAENIVQAVARDVFASQIVRMEKLGWRNLFSSHDEAILEVEPTITAADVEREMSHCPDWIPGLPVAAEAKEVEHYLK